MTNAEAWFNIALRPRKPEGSLGRTARDGHLDSHTAPELRDACIRRTTLSTTPPTLSTIFNSVADGGPSRGQASTASPSSALPVRVNSLSDVEGFDQNCLRRGVRRHSEIEVSTSPQPGEEDREADTIFTMQLWNEMRTTTVDVRRSISVGDDFTKGQTLP